MTSPLRTLTYYSKMNFESEADVHAFIERQTSNIALNPIFHAELNPASDENDIEILQQSVRGSRTAKGAAARGAFGELLKRSIAEQENAATPESFTKLEDMFPEETTAQFRERFFENPLLCDEVPSKEQQKRLRMKDITGSIRSFASSRFGSSSARDESGESPYSIVRMMSGDETPLPRPSIRSSSRQRSMKKVSFDQSNQFGNAGEEDDEEIEVENRRMSFRRPRLSLPTIVQRLVVRIGSFGKNDEIIRDPGNNLPLPLQKRQSVDSRKSSKTTVATDDSKTSVSSRLMKFFTV